MNLFSRIRFLLRIVNFRTLYFNLHYLPFAQALKFPFFVSRNFRLIANSGSVRIEGPISTGMVRIGFGEVNIFDRKASRGIWEVRGTVIFKGNANIGHGSKISVGDQGVLEIGEEFNITAESAVVAWKEIRIGRRCLFSWDVLVMDTDFHSMMNSAGEIMNAPRPINIGNDVWIGCRSLVLKGTTIPNGCIIGAQSTVSSMLDAERSLYAGTPVRKIKDDVFWKL